MLFYVCFGLYSLYILDYFNLMFLMMCLFVCWIYACYCVDWLVGLLAFVNGVGLVCASLGVLFQKFMYLRICQIL